MDVNDPQFDTYRQRFEALADLVPVESGRQPEVSSARYFLCLYGDNGMTPDDELALLAVLDDYLQKGLKRMDVQTAIWEDVILYVPQDAPLLPEKLSAGTAT